MRKLLESLDTIVDGNPVKTGSKIEKPKSDGKFLGSPYHRRDKPKSKSPEDLSAQFEDYVKNKAVPDSKKEYRVVKKGDALAVVLDEKGVEVTSGTKSDCESYIRKKKAELNDAKLAEGSSSKEKQKRPYKTMAQHVEAGKAYRAMVAADKKAKEAEQIGKKKTTESAGSWIVYRSATDFKKFPTYKAACSFQSKWSERGYKVASAEWFYDKMAHNDQSGKAGDITEARNDTIEAHGIRGMDRKPWRRTFKNVEQMEAWCEKYDAEVYATRDTDAAAQGKLTPAMSGKTVDESGTGRKSENRQLWDKINSKGVVPSIDRERYTDLSGEGLEGPFRGKNGQVLYYDPRAGKYYSRDSDMYVDHGLDEGLSDVVKRGVKSVKRGLQGWGNNMPDGGPADIAKRNKSYSDSTIKTLSHYDKPAGSTEKYPEHSPRGLQKRVLDREMKKRGLTTEETTDESATSPEWDEKRVRQFTNKKGPNIKKSGNTSPEWDEKRVRQFTNKKGPNIKKSGNTSPEWDEKRVKQFTGKKIEEEVESLDEAKTHEVRLEFGHQPGDSITYKVSAKDSADARKKAISLHRKSYPYHSVGMLDANAYVSNIKEEVESLDEAFKMPERATWEKVNAHSNRTIKAEKLAKTDPTPENKQSAKDHRAHLNKLEALRNKQLKNGTLKTGYSVMHGGNISESSLTRSEKIARLKEAMENVAEQLKQTRRHVTRSVKAVDEDTPPPAGVQTTMPPQPKPVVQTANPVKPAQQALAPGQQVSTTQQAPAPAGTPAAAPQPGQPTTPAAGQAGGTPVAPATPGDMVKGLVQTLAQNPAAAKQLGTKLSTIR